VVRHFVQERWILEIDHVAPIPTDVVKLTHPFSAHARWELCLTVRLIATRQTETQI
jgi:hypothetical protein